MTVPGPEEGCGPAVFLPEARGEKPALACASSSLRLCGCGLSGQHLQIILCLVFCGRHLLYMHVEMFVSLSLLKEMLLKAVRDDKGLTSLGKTPWKSEVCLVCFSVPSSAAAGESGVHFLSILVQTHKKTVN